MSADRGAASVTATIAKALAEFRGWVITGRDRREAEAVTDALLARPARDSDVRCIWMTRADAMGKGLYGEWLAAPADPTEAAIMGTLLPKYTENDRAFVRPIVLNVLRALGAPDA